LADAETEQSHRQMSRRQTIREQFQLRFQQLLRTWVASSSVSERKLVVKSAKRTFNSTVRPMRSWCRSRQALSLWAPARLKKCKSRIR
jgi:hypothetical protein